MVLLLAVAALAGCSGEEKTVVGDNPISSNARSAKDPEFAEKRAKHTLTPPPASEEGVR